MLDYGNLDIRVGRGSSPLTASRVDDSAPSLSWPLEGLTSMYNTSTLLLVVCGAIPFIDGITIGYIDSTLRASPRLQLVMVGIGRSRSLRCRRHGDIASLLGLALTTGHALGLVFAVLLDKSGQVLHGARPRILNGLALGTSRVELDGREASDRIRDVVGGGVDLGNGDLLGQITRVHLGELVVFGRKRLAVTAPRGIELQQDILVIVDDELLVALADNNGDRALLGLGDGLGLDTRLDLALQNILDELANGLGLDLFGLVEGVLDVLCGVLDGKGWERLWLQIKVASVGTKQLGIQGDNVDGTAVLLGDRLELVGEGLALLRGLREDVRQRNTSLWIIRSVMKSD